MKPKRIFLIRHGESEGNADPSVHALVPDYALRLTPAGRLQARAAGETLRGLLGLEPAQVYVSPFFRTRETFAELNQAFPEGQLTYREEPRLREQEWGHQRSLADGAEVDRVRDAYGPFYFRIPDGESAADVYDRVSDFFHTLHRDFDKPGFPPNALMVTHGMTIRLFLMRWFHWTVEEFEALGNPENCAIIVMERQENGEYLLLTHMKERAVKHTWRFTV